MPGRDEGTVALVCRGCGTPHNAPASAACSFVRCPVCREWNSVSAKSAAGPAIAHHNSAPTSSSEARARIHQQGDSGSSPGASPERNGLQVRAPRAEGRPASLDIEDTDPGLCYFCGRNKGDGFEAIAVPMHGNVRRVFREHTSEIACDRKTVRIPRCAACGTRQRLMPVWGCITALLFLVGVAFWVYLWLENLDLLYAVAGLVALPVGLFAARKACYSIPYPMKFTKVPHEDFPEIRRLLSEGWRLGEGPTDSEAGHARTFANAGQAVPCYFCERRPAAPPETVEVGMCGNVRLAPDATTFLSERRTIAIPRCPECRAIHNRIQRWSEVIGGLPVAIGFLAGLWGTACVTEDHGLPVVLGFVGLAVGAVIGGILVWRYDFGKSIAMRCVPYAVKGLHKQNDFPEIQRLLSEGWEIRGEPSTEQVSRAWAAAPKCHICLEPVPAQEGYVLTTREVVTTPAYWKIALTRSGIAGPPTCLRRLDLAKLLAWRILRNASSEPTFLPQDDVASMFESCIRMQCAQITGWMTCEKCMPNFPRVPREQARMYARDFWRRNADGDYSPPGGGAVDPSEALAAAEEAWRNVAGTEPPRTGIFSAASAREIWGTNTPEISGLKPGQEVPRTGTYRCLWCGPQGKLAFAMSVVSSRLPRALSLPALSKGPTTFRRFRKGSVFPECPNGCRGATEWSLVSEEEQSK